MKTITIKKVEAKLLEILEIFTGAVTQDEKDCDYLNVKVNTTISLNNVKLKRLMKLGMINLKRSGNGITITIKILK